MITVRIVGISLDRRSPEQLRSADAIEQKRFAWKVHRNAKEQLRLSNVVPLLRRQAQ
jgi:hypothetical protein